MSSTASITIHPTTGSERPSDTINAPKEVRGRMTSLASVAVVLVLVLMMLAVFWRSLWWV